MAVAEITERVLPLEGGRNFRDLGGYETQDGRRLRWGRLYRSGSMAALSDAALKQLASMGVRCVCDLRTTSEREAGPLQWERVPNLGYYARDYDASFGDLRSLLAAEMPTAQQARDAMITVYRQLPFEQAPAYGELFRRLAGGEVPLVFNCSAGKDRTGVAAALILGAVGVSEETIIEDYLLSNLTYDRSASPAYSLIERVGNEVSAAVLGVDDAYIRAALEVIHDEHQSMPRYLRDRLGVSERDLKAIQDQLLE